MEGGAGTKSFIMAQMSSIKLTIAGTKKSLRFDTFARGKKLFLKFLCPLSSRRIRGEGEGEGRP